MFRAVSNAAQVAVHPLDQRVAAVAQLSSHGVDGDWTALVELGDGHEAIDLPLSKWEESVAGGQRLRRSNTRSYT